MNNLPNKILVFVILGIASGIMVFSLIAEGASDTCNSEGKKFVALISQSGVTPQTIVAHRCDTLTIVNRDSVVREIGFGPHDDHVPYDEVSERIIKHNEQFTIHFVQLGTFYYHDHFHDEVKGQFSVKPEIWPNS